MQRYRIEFEQQALNDLQRLHEFLLAAMPEYADQSLDRIHQSFKALGIIPQSCRKADIQTDRTLRELVIDQGRSGYLALFEIRPDDCVLILAVRHQRESDYH
jgi:plasmid stabilization system protein ParE